MARTIKAGLDYFPLDVDMDEKIELVEAKHGIVGFGIIIKLYQAIYKTGYYANVDEERLLLFSKRINVDINSINVVINDAIRWGIFHEDIFKTYHILTSCGIQKRYIEATKRRQEVEFLEHILLVKDVAERYGDRVNVNIKAINVNINPINTDIGTQRKGKERKEKESREESPQKRIQKTPTPAPIDFPITDKMRAYAASKHYGGDLAVMTEKFVNYHSSKGNKFSDWTAAWRNWLLKDIEFNGGNTQQPKDRNGGKSLEEVLS